MDKTTQISEDEEVVKLRTKKKIFLLKSVPFDIEIDGDKLTQIDYSNLFGEMITFPVVVNKLGNLRADVEEILEEKKLELEFKKAELEKMYRNNMSKPIERAVDGKIHVTIKKPINSEVDNAVFLDKGYQILSKNLINLQTKFNKIDKLYWNCKEKLKILQNLSANIRPEEHENEILQETINGVKIVIKDRLTNSKNLK